MSKQLAIASAFSVFALSALALFAPETGTPDPRQETGATIEIVAPAMVTSLISSE